MKRKLYSILGIFVLYVLCSCSHAHKTLNLELLSQEVQDEIKQDYAKYKNDTTNSNGVAVDDVMIEHYFGTYQEDAIALFLSANEAYLTVEVEEDISGIHFTFPSSQPIYIYHNRTFVSLKQACRDGLILKEDVKDINYYFEQIYK